MSCQKYIKNQIQNFPLVTLVGLLSPAVVHLLKIFQHILTAYLSPTWNLWLRTFNVKDTSDFITKIHNLKCIPQNAFLITLDVKTLYSNIPHSDCIKVCDRFMSEGGKSQASRSVISKLINLVLTKNDFQFNGKSYLQGK